MSPSTGPFPDQCEACGVNQGESPLRSIKLRSGRRETLCEECFADKRDADEVHPCDPRIDARELR